ncbi:MAG: PucR family transcriptional regulator [Eubacteriales bacterium]
MVLRELLQESKLEGLCVLNKSANLERKVVTVESTETPDVAAFLPADTLLITTGMTYKTNQDALCELIETLDQLPCAGLAIKLGRFIHELKPEVIEMADQLGFPLIQIPMNMTLGDVYKQALAVLWNDKSEDLNYALNTQKKFSNLILQGSSTKIILNNLGNALKKPVAIVSPFGEVVEVGYGCNDRHKTEAKELFLNYQLYEQKFTQIEHYMDAEKGKNKVVIFPIKIDGWVSHCLYIFEAEDLSTALTSLVVEQVVLILSVSLYKSIYLTYNEVKSKEEFLEILIQKNKDKVWNGRQILSIGAKYGIKGTEYYGAIIGTLGAYRELKVNGSSAPHSEERYIFIYRWLEQFLEEKYQGSILVFPQISDYRYIFILQGNHEFEIEDMKQIYYTLQKMLKIEIIFSLGNVMLEIDSLPYSYEEGLESFIDGEIQNDIFFIKHYKPKNAIELLKAIPSEQAKKFSIHNLKSLAYPKDEMTLELQKTLRTYLECNGSITETASTMFMHRNTIKYRIKKCEEILGHDFTDPKQYFQLLLSLVLVEEQD